MHHSRPNRSKICVHLGNLWEKEKTAKRNLRDLSKINLPENKKASEIFRNLRL